MGAARLRDFYHRCRVEFAGRPFREAATFERAYLIHLLQEMVEAVFGAEHVRNSVSQFSPDSLTMVAGRAARVAAPPTDASFTPSDAPCAGLRPLRPLSFDYPFDRLKERWNRVESRAKKRWERKYWRIGRTPPPLAGDLFERPTLDPMPLASRIMLGVLVALMASILAAVLDDRGPGALFFVLQAPDVALSEIAVNTAATPLLFMAAIAAITINGMRQ